MFYLFKLVLNLNPVAVFLYFKVTAYVFCNPLFSDFRSSMQVACDYVL